MMTKIESVVPPQSRSCHFDRHPAGRVNRREVPRPPGFVFLDRGGVAACFHSSDCLRKGTFNRKLGGDSTGYSGSRANSKRRLPGASRMEGMSEPEFPRVGASRLSTDGIDFATSETLV